MHITRDNDVHELFVCILSSLELICFINKLYKPAGFFFFLRKSAFTSSFPFSIAFGSGQFQISVQKGGELTKSSPTEKDVGLLMNEKQDRSQQCVLTALEGQQSSGLHQQKGQWAKRGLSPSVCPCEALYGALRSNLGPPAQERRGAVGPEGTGMLKDGALLHGDRLRVFRRLWGDVLVAFQYLRRAFKQQGD